MKLKLTNFKINGRLFDETLPMSLYVPTEDKYPDMIGWMTDYELPNDTSTALTTYIRNYILYNMTIDYTVELLIGKEADQYEAAKCEHAAIPDIVDHQYKTYQMAKFELTLPKYLVLDDDSFLFADYAEDLHQTIFDALLNNLSMTIREIEFE